MRHFFSSKVRTVLILAVLLAVGLAVFSNLTGTDYPGMLVQSVMTPLRAGFSTLWDQAEQYYSYMFGYEALAAENAALKEQLAQMQSDLAGVKVGEPESVKGKLQGILSNPVIFGVNLYEAGLAEKVEALLVEELAGPGAVRATLKKYLG